MYKRTGLTEKEEAFLDYYIESADATDAAIKAGYSKKTAGVAGSKLKRKLENEIRERVGKNFGSLSVRAAKIMGELMEKSTNEQTRCNAAKDILDRGGFKPVDKTEDMTDYENLDPQQIHAQVAASLAKDPGMLIDLLKQDEAARTAVLKAIMAYMKELKESQMQPPGAEASQENNGRCVH